MSKVISREQVSQYIDLNIFCLVVRVTYSVVLYHARDMLLYGCLICFKVDTS